METTTRTPTPTSTEPSSTETGFRRWAKPIDITTVRQFQSWAIELMSPGEKGPLLLDLSDCAHLDLSGLQVLVALAVQALSSGRFLEISKASYQVQRDLQLAGVAYLLRQE